MIQLDLGRMWSSLFLNEEVKEELEEKSKTRWQQENEQQLDQDYTMNIYFEAKKRQNRLMLEERLPEVLKEYNEKVQILYNSSSSLFIQDKNYNSFVYSINELNDELNLLDSPEKIYYDDGEPLLLHEPRKTINSLKLEVDTKINLYEVEKQIHKVKVKPSPGQNDWCVFVKLLHDLTNQLAADIDNNIELYQYQHRLRLLQSELKHLLLIIQRYNTIESTRKKIQELTTKINALPISTDLDKFHSYFKNAEKLRSELIDLNKEIRGLEQILQEIDDLMNYIQFKINDSSISTGWTRASLVTGVLSLGTVFVPAVGIPLSVGLNVIPVIGKFLHRQWLKEKNDK